MTGWVDGLANEAREVSRVKSWVTKQTPDSSGGCNESFLYSEFCLVYSDQAKRPKRRRAEGVQGKTRRESRESRGLRSSNPDNTARTKFVINCGQ